MATATSLWVTNIVIMIQGKPPLPPSYRLSRILYERDIASGIARVNNDLNYFAILSLSICSSALIGALLCQAAIYSTRTTANSTSFLPSSLT